MIKSRSVKLLFIGSTHFSLRCLEALNQHDSGVELSGIITAGQTFRSHTGRVVNNVRFEDLKDYATKYSVPFYRIQKDMNELPLQKFIDSIECEFGLCVGWYHRVPNWLLERVKIAGLHASLLPDYSGGSPLVWAMINGEKKTGISLFLFTDQMDAGDIIGQREIEILDEDDIRTLYSKVEVLGCELIQEFLPRIADGSATYQKQDKLKRRTFPLRHPEDGLIDWTWEPKRIKNFIRAQTRPYPGAYTILEGKKIIIWDADIVDEE